MENQDSIHLLQECNSGSKMAISSIRDVMDDVEEKALKEILEEAIGKHEEYGEEIHAVLSGHHAQPEEPKPYAKAMAKVVTGAKMLADHSTGQIANLMIDGCNMGIKSISKFQNEYENADQESKKLAEKLIEIEQKMSEDLRPFLS